MVYKNYNKEAVYTGSPELISKVITICNQFLGYPIVIVHNEDDNIYVEYNNDCGIGTIYSIYTKNRSFLIKVNICVDDAKFCDHILNTIDASIKHENEYVSFITACLLNKENINETRTEGTNT